MVVDPRPLHNAAGPITPAPRQLETNLNSELRNPNSAMQQDLGAILKIAEILAAARAAGMQDPQPGPHLAATPHSELRTPNSALRTPKSPLP